MQRLGSCPDPKLERGPYPSWNLSLKDRDAPQVPALWDWTDGGAHQAAQVSALNARINP
jgi:hypothetical protein